MKRTTRPEAKKLILGGLALVTGLAACGTTTTERLRLPPLTTVARVELRRYIGTWYEIASYPQRFQKGCTGTTATYTLRADGEIDVVNRCYKGSLKGKLATAEGRARVKEAGDTTRLEVSFFRPFWGDYWVIDLGERYEYAVVSHPSRDYLWILSRTPTMDPAVYDGILKRLQQQGFPLDRLKKTLQRKS